MDVGDDAAPGLHSADAVSPRREGHHFSLAGSTDLTLDKQFEAIVTKEGEC